MARLIELADTSAWTSQHKDPDASTEFRRRVRSREIATCDIVKLELLYSAQDARDFRERRQDLEALTSFPIDQTVWRRATDVFEQLASQGPLHHRRVSLPGPPRRRNRGGRRRPALPLRQGLRPDRVSHRAAGTRDRAARLALDD